MPNPNPIMLRGLKAATPTNADSEPGVSKTPSGSPASYMGPDQGPFECDNCEYYVDPGNCKRPEVLKEVGDPDKDGLADVDPKGCCNFYTKDTDA